MTAGGNGGRATRDRCKDVPQAATHDSYKDACSEPVVEEGTVRAYCAARLTLRMVRAAVVANMGRLAEEIGATGREA